MHGEPGKCAIAVTVVRFGSFLRFIHIYHIVVSKCCTVFLKYYTVFLSNIGYLKFSIDVMYVSISLLPD